MRKVKKTTDEILPQQSLSLQPNTGEVVTVERLITEAIKKNVPPETMEKFLVMRRELKAEFAKKAFDEAMAAFQAECPTIIKTKEVKTKSGVVAYRYAPIESIVQQVAPFLQRHGFSYATSMELLPSGVRVTVKITHKDGHAESSLMEVPLGNKTDIMSQSQVVAAAQTFAKRYAFCNAFGILTGDEDNDGRIDSLKETKKSQPPSTVSDKTKIAHLAKLLKIEMDAFFPEEIMRLTGLEFIEDNYANIVDALEIIFQERRELGEL